MYVMCDLCIYGALGAYYASSAASLYKAEISSESVAVPLSPPPHSEIKRKMNSSCRNRKGRKQGMEGGSRKEREGGGKETYQFKKGRLKGRKETYQLRRKPHVLSK